MLPFLSDEMAATMLRLFISLVVSLMGIKIESGLMSPLNRIAGYFMVSQACKRFIPPSKVKNSSSAIRYVSPLKAKCGLKVKIFRLSSLIKALPRDKLFRFTHKESK